MGPWQELVAIRVAELRAMEEARTTVERHYLAGRTALFPSIARAWDERRRETEELADLGNRLNGMTRSPVRHGAPAREDGTDTVRARIDALIADLVEPARIAALLKLDENERAMPIAERWLRPKLQGYTSGPASTS